MKFFAISFLVLGAGFLAAAIIIFLTRGFGDVTSTLIITFGCIGVPFFLFGAWGTYLELKPYDPDAYRTPKKMKLGIIERFER
jgi:hypothetical protein